MSGLIDAPTFVRWRRVEAAALLEAPAIHASADTTSGVTHLWVLFGQRKLFLLQLSTVQGAGVAGAALGAAVLATAQLK